MLLTLLLLNTEEQQSKDDTNVCATLARLEQQDSNLPQIEIDEVLRFMCYVRTEVSSHYAVPSWVVLLVELLLDICSNILLIHKTQRRAM